MSLHPCIECGNKVRPHKQALQCDDCGFWQHRICGTGIDQATYRLAIIRGRISWLCVACSFVASNPSDQVPAAESTRTDFTQGTEILSPLFVPEIILFFIKNLTFLRFLTFTRKHYTHWFKPFILKSEWFSIVVPLIGWKIVTKTRERV